MLLFAYGSNMAAEEMAAFAPEAHFVAVARLPGFRLELRRRSRRWGGGAADVVESKGDEVWGALYEVPGLELLDRKEGTGFAYRRRRVEVDVENDRRRTTALVYEVIEKEPQEVAATAEYAALVLDAARRRGLPSAWLRELEARFRAG